MSAPHSPLPRKPSSPGISIRVTVSRQSREAGSPRVSTEKPDPSWQAASAAAIFIGCCSYISFPWMSPVTTVPTNAPIATTAPARSDHLARPLPVHPLPLGAPGHHGADARTDRHHCPCPQRPQPHGVVPPVPARCLRRLSDDHPPVRVDGVHTVVPAPPQVVPGDPEHEHPRHHERRSEERRVGKECRAGGSRGDCTKQRTNREVRGERVI